MTTGFLNEAAQRRIGRFPTNTMLDKRADCSWCAEKHPCDQDH